MSNWDKGRSFGKFMYNSQASDIAYEYIAGKIRKGEWQPGDKIATEAQLCEDIHVSRIAVRQAIEKLVALSVLKKIQGSGTYVEQIENMSIMSASVLKGNREQTLGILEFRKMFDPYNVELFIKRCSYSEVADLEENYRKMVDAAGDMKSFQYLDQEFHNIIANGTRNMMIIQISNLFNDIFNENQAELYHSVGPDNAIKYHKYILENIKERNTELAAIYARMSIEQSIKQISAIESEEF